MGFYLTVENQTIAKRLISDICIYGNNTKVWCTALWDTGSSQSCISSTLAKSLNLKKFRDTKLFSVEGNTKQNTYIVDITLFGNIKNHITKEKYVLDLAAEVIEISEGLPELNIDVLIGMDIIQHGDFAVSNFNNKTTFTFRYPSKEKIDFRE